MPSPSELEAFEKRKVLLHPDQYDAEKIAWAQTPVAIRNPEYGKNPVHDRRPALFVDATEITLPPELEAELV